MENIRLFRLAPEAVAITAVHRAGEGWTLILHVRRGDEDWLEAPQDVYRCLTTPELLDTCCGVLAARLGL